jgi:hypothetical protein
MSYVGGPFKHDVFVTYSHGDVVGNDDSLLKQWSQAFAAELANEMRVLPGVGRALSLFLDQGHRAGQAIDPMEPLSPQLQAEIAASAVVAVLLSPQYLASRWCTDEREWWREGQTKHKISPTGRIALARIWPLTSGDALPELFLDGRGEPLPGFWFFDRALDAARCRPYEWPKATTESGGSFRKALVELAGFVYGKLEELRRRLEESKLAAADAAKLCGAEPVVYLHARTEHAAAWEKANDELSTGGFTVLPTEPDTIAQSPEQAQQVRSQRIETLANCDALLLLGSADGRALDSDLLAVGRHERQLARARWNRLLPCALLDTVGEAIATDRRRLTARKLQVDWIDRRAEPWVPSVQSWLKQKGDELAGEL